MEDGFIQTFSGGGKAVVNFVVAFAPKIGNIRKNRNFDKENYKNVRMGIM